MNIWICDDEVAITHSITQKIKLRYPHATITKFHSAFELLQHDDTFDILFLDIEMPEMSGLQLAEKLRAHQQLNPIIFVTAHEQYVFQAFDVQAFHYLLKPFDTKKIYDVLKLAQAHYATPLKEEPYIVLKSGFDLRKIYFYEVYYIEVFGRKLTFHLEHETITINGRLKEYEQQLGKSFFKVNRSYLVNLQYIASYTKQHITLDHGVTLSLAQKKYSEFVQAYMDFIQHKGTVHV